MFAGLEKTKKLFANTICIKTMFAENSNKTNKKARLIHGAEATIFVKLSKNISSKTEIKN